LSSFSHKISASCLEWVILRIVKAIVLKILFLYGDNFLKFMAVKKRLDPDNVFSNAYIDRIFSSVDEAMP
jgi:hypothetical protein